MNDVSPWASRQERRHGALARVAVFLILNLWVAGHLTASPFDHFEPDPESPSWANTYLLAIAAGNAYRGRVKDFEGDGYAEKFQHLYTPLGLTVDAFIESSEDGGTGTQALVVSNEVIVLVIFCGSEGHDSAAAMRDWLTDAKIWPLEVDGRRIHRGFHQALESVWSDLDAAVQESLDGDRALWLTGHSLGAALANLAAFRWSLEQVPVAGVYTFAAPKTGDAAFVASFQEELGTRSQQWSTILDPVPHVPEIARRSAYEKLGVTNVVHASGEAELDTTQRVAGVPNPMAHRVSSYVNYLYRALPDETRESLPRPPALCALYTRHVGAHPDNGYPLCRDRFLKVRRERCLKRGGEILEPWCLTADDGKFRYLTQKLKPRLKKSQENP